MRASKLVIIYKEYYSSWKNYYNKHNKLYESDIIKYEASKLWIFIIQQLLAGPDLVSDDFLCQFFQVKVLPCFRNSRLLSRCYAKLFIFRTVIKYTFAFVVLCKIIDKCSTVILLGLRWVELYKKSSWILLSCVIFNRVIEVDSLWISSWIFTSSWVVFDAHAKCNDYVLT